MVSGPVRLQAGNELFDDLDYMRARYFSAHVGRFWSPDPVDSATLRHPQSWNKYGYVRSNPLKFLDPTGEVEVHFTFNALIPFDSVKMPVVGRIFEGDGAGFSAGRTSLRIQQQFTIETDPSVSANPLVSVSQPKIGVTRELNAQGGTIATGQASGEGVTVGAQRLSDGTVLLTARGHSTSPLVALAPGYENCP